ncbi:MAG TPA: hypothetical protein VGV14_18880 [Rhodanobacter sp.]|nr:hypothetical protein [Rhodanobacter sp.]
MAAHKVSQANMQNDLAGVVRYRYKWRLLPLIWMSFFVPFSIYMGIYAISPKGGGGLSGWLILLILPTFMLFIGWVVILGVSDVVMCDQGIYRMAFGITWQKMRWIDVAEIRISNTVSPADGKKVRSFLFVASKESGAFLSRRIAFQERKRGMEYLLNRMNTCISRYGIEVVDTSTA